MTGSIPHGMPCETRRVERDQNFYRPQRSWGQGYVFTRVCDSVHWGGGIPACIAGGIPACLAAGLKKWGGIPACLAGFQAHTKGGKLRGLARGSPGPHLGGSPGPHPGRCIPACTEADPPNGYCCGQYASYWNAFLYRVKLMAFISFKLYYVA